MKALCRAFVLALAIVLEPKSVHSLPMLKTLEELAFGIVPRQSEPSSCGYAVMAGVLNLVKKSYLPIPTEMPGLITEEYLLKRYEGIATAGSHAPLSLLDMIYILADFGVDSLPMKLDAGLLGTALKTTKPLIIHYDQPVSHFIVGLCADGEFLTVADPECGIISLHESELAARASGFVLLPLTERQDEKIYAEKLSTGIQTAMDRRIVLMAATESTRPATGKQRNDRSPFHGEAGVYVGSSKAETGTATFSPGLFFNAEWAVSSSCTLLGSMRVLTAIWPMIAKDFEISSGIEMHRENKEKNQSIGAMLLIAAGLRTNRQSIGFAESFLEMFSDPGFSSLEPQLRFRFSRIVDPFLLTGTVGIKLFLPLLPHTEPQPEGKGICLFSLPVEVSTLCAFSPLLIGKAALEQEFLFLRDGKNPLEWKAAVSFGMSIPLGSLLIYAGTKIRLNYGSNTNGEAVFSCTF